MPISVPSYNELLGNMLRKLYAIAGVNDTHKGSVLLTLLEAAAQNDSEQFATLLDMLDLFSLDATTGADLDKRSIELGLTQGRLPATKSSGYVTFTDSTITKVSTAIYVGSAAPIAGSNTLNVNDASSLAAAQSIYVGRGTLSSEGPLVIASVTNNTTYWTIQLVGTLAHNHAVNESVIKAQGGSRVIAAGTSVKVPANNTSTEKSFKTQASATIQDGEAVIENVLVTAQAPGASSNVPFGTINQFTTIPFTGCTVTNPASFSNAEDLETDDELRDRIKSHIQSLSKGVEQAILSGVVGVFDPDEAKKVISATLVEPTTAGEVTTLYIDDGTGFEPSFSGGGVEDVITSAAGTEQFLQLGNYPVVKAQATSTSSQPYDFSVGRTLVVKVNGVTEEIVLTPSAFQVPSNASAIEVASAINDASASVGARTASGQTTVVIYPLTDASLEVVAGGANDALQFPTELAYALKLYRDDVLLYQNGLTATQSSSDYSTWAGITDPTTITVTANGKPTQYIRLGTASLEVSVNGTNWIGVSGASFFSDLGTTIQSASLTQWVTILNQALQGCTASANGAQLLVTSDLFTSASSSLVIGGAAQTYLGFSSTESTGQPSDYYLNRFSGQIELATPLTTGESISVGSLYTRGATASASASTFDTSKTSTRSAKLFVVVDGSTTVRTVNLIAGTSTITITNPAGSTFRYTANSSAFTDISVGDYVVVNRIDAGPYPNEGIFLVTGAAATYFEVHNVSGSALGATAVISASDVQAFVSDTAPQVITLPDSAVTTPAQVVTAATLIGATATSTATQVTLTSNNYESGSIQVAATTLKGASLGFDLSGHSTAAPHVAAITSASELTYPVSLAKGVLTSNDTSSPYTTITDTARGIPNSVTTPDQIVKWVSGNNRGVQAVIESWDAGGAPNVVTLKNSATDNALPLNELMIGDAYQQFTPYDLDARDSVVVIVDGDELAKTYSIPLYRNGRATSANSGDLTGLDTDGPAGSTYLNSRWATYDFADYKVLLHSHYVVNPTGTKNALIIRAVDYGHTGDFVGFGYFYPPKANYPVLPTDLVVNVTNTYYQTKVAYTFRSGALRATAQAAATQFNISNAGTTVTYHYNGTGTAPAWVANGVVAGDIVTFNASSFSAENNGTFRVSSVTATDLVVINNLTTPVPEVNKALGVSTAISVYPLTLNTANQVVTDLTADSVAKLIVTATKTVLDPFGTSNDGTGHITKSTIDDAQLGNTVLEYQMLVDGVNYVAAYSNAGPIPFTLKRAWDQLSVSDGGEIYNIGSAPNPDATTGEVFVLVPTTAANLKDHLNSTVISGLSVNAVVERSHGGVQISSLTAGSAGSVQVAGGFGNAVSANVTKVGSIETVLGSSTSRLTIATSQAYSLHAIGNVKLTNTSVTKKVNTFNALTTASTSMVSTLGQFTLGDRASTALSATTGITVTGAGTGHGIYTITAGTGDFTTITAGDEVFIRTGSPFNAGNEGVFVVLSTSATVLTVINSATVNEVIGAGPFVANDVVGKIPLFEHPSVPIAGVVVRLDALNDSFATIRVTTGTANFLKNGVDKDFYVTLGAPFSAANLGRYRVLDVDNTSIVIDLPNAVAESVTMVAETITGAGEITEGTLSFYSGDSAVTGDLLHVATLPVSGWFNPSALGDFEVVGVGRDVTTKNQFVYVSVDTTLLNQSVVLGSNANSFYVVEGEPFYTYDLITNVAPNSADITETYVWTASVLHTDRYSATNGTIITALGKTGWDTTVSVGQDGYQYWTGLLRRVSRTVDGYDPDPITYPGIKAAGVQIEVLPPRLQRVQVSLNVTPVNGLALSAISDTIKGAVLGYISSLGVGDDVVLSQIVKSVQSVSGVDAVVVTNPVPSTERIILQDAEKAISFSTDITVT